MLLTLLTQPITIVVVQLWWVIQVIQLKVPLALPRGGGRIQEHSVIPVNFSIHADPRRRPNQSVDFNRLLFHFIQIIIFISSK